MKKTPLLTALELEIMQIIWKQNDISVGSIEEKLSKNGRVLALPSIRTMLSILQKKGFVSRHQKGKAYLYTPIISNDDFQHNFILDLLGKAFDGSATSLVTALLSEEIVSKKELGQIKEMIKNFEAEE